MYHCFVHCLSSFLCTIFSVLLIMFTDTLLPTFLSSMLAFFIGCWFTSISINSSAHNAFSHVHLFSFLILEHCSIPDAGSTSSYWCWDEQPATSWESSMWVAICAIGHWGQYSGSIFKREFVTYLIKCQSLMYNICYDTFSTGLLCLHFR
jgi:hypothetical protein